MGPYLNGALLAAWKKMLASLVKIFYFTAGMNPGSGANPEGIGRRMWIVSPATSPFDFTTANIRMRRTGRLFLNLQQNMLHQTQACVFIGVGSSACSLRWRRRKSRCSPYGQIDNIKRFENYAERDDGQKCVWERRSGFVAPDA